MFSEKFDPTGTLSSFNPVSAKTLSTIPTDAALVSDESAWRCQMQSRAAEGLLRHRKHVPEQKVTLLLLQAQPQLLSPECFRSNKQYPESNGETTQNDKPNTTYYMDHLSFI